MHNLLRALGEPFALFVLGAGALFGLDAALRPAPHNIIRVSQAQIEALAALHEARTGAPPSEDGLRHAVDNLVEEEALYRYGLQLGLVEGDPIVRRRIVEKIRQAARRTVATDEAALERWYADGTAAYLTCRDRHLVARLARLRKGRRDDRIRPAPPGSASSSATTARATEDVESRPPPLRTTRPLRVSRFPSEIDGGTSTRPHSVGGWDRTVPNAPKAFPSAHGLVPSKAPAAGMWPES